MYMGRFRFKCWCSDAVSGIIFPPDQRKVSEELYHHLEDHYEALVEQGMDKEEAVKATLAAMGDAREIAPQLAAIHRPFWGYFLRVTRILLIIFLLATAVPLGKFIYNAYYWEPSVWGFDAYDPDAYAEKGHTLLQLTEPNCSVKSDGYSFTITDAAQWYYNSADDAGSAQSRGIFCCRMVVFNPLPWAEEADIGDLFWAEDNLGNRYHSIYDYEGAIGGQYLFTSSNETSPFTSVCQIWVNNYEFEGVEWFTIHYDRDGRDLTWSIDLTGGDTP